MGSTSHVPIPHSTSHVAVPHSTSHVPVPHSTSLVPVPHSVLLFVVHNVGSLFHFTFQTAFQFPLCGEALVPVDFDFLSLSLSFSLCHSHFLSPLMLVLDAGTLVVLDGYVSWWRCWFCFLDFDFHHWTLYHGSDPLSLLPNHSL